MAGMTRSSSSSSPTSGTGPGLHPAHVEQVGAVVHQPLGPAEELVQGVGGPLVVEGVGGAVEDAHHQGPVADVEGPVAEGEDGRVHVGDAIRRYATGGTGRPGQNSRAASCLAVAGGPRVVRSEGLQQVEELLAGGRRRRGPGRAGRRSRSSTSTPSTSTCWEARPGLGQQQPGLRRLGDAPEQGDGLVGARPRAIIMAARATMAPGWSGWSSRARRSGSSVPARTPSSTSRSASDGAGRQPGHELGHRRLGLGADERVDHLAVLEANTAGIDCTWKLAEMAGLSSTLTLTRATAPSVASTTRSMTGPRVWHGPHQGAHRSTTTGTSDERRSTSSSNVASVTSTIAMTIPGDAGPGRA